jgi:hypothetical protein
MLGAVMNQQEQNNAYKEYKYLDKGQDQEAPLEVQDGE